MKARFIGDPNDNFSGPDVFPLRGVTFLKDKWTSVADVALFEKLLTHNHFETRDAGFVSIEPEVPTDETGLKPWSSDAFYDAVRATATAEFATADQGVIAVAGPDAFATFDRDGDGKPGGSNASDEKAALIAQLEAMPGAEFDGRWGVPKLRQALEAARFMAGDED